MAKKKTQHHTYGHDIIRSPGKKVCLDFVGLLKRTKKGHTSLLTVVDTYTRWFHAWPIKNQTLVSVKYRTTYLLEVYLLSFIVTTVPLSLHRSSKQP